MSKPEIDFPAVIKKFDKVLKRGLCNGLGNRNGRMCIEAAICYALDLPHGDNPSCVELAVRIFKITLNDSAWSSPTARAAGLRDLGIAQIGSAGVVSGVAFSTLLAKRTIQIIIPKIFQEVFPDNPKLLALATTCQKEGTGAAAGAAALAARAAGAAARAAALAAGAARAAAEAAARTAARAAALAAEAAAGAAGAADEYLLLSAKIALEVLKELKSPGCEWL